VSLHEGHRGHQEGCRRLRSQRAADWRQIQAAGVSGLQNIANARTTAASAPRAAARGTTDGAQSAGMGVKKKTLGGTRPVL
jgi:hypothetical protein